MEKEVITSPMDLFIEGFGKTVYTMGMENMRITSDQDLELIRGEMEINTLENTKIIKGMV